jgi:hypothetical protein
VQLWRQALHAEVLPVIGTLEFNNLARQRPTSQDKMRGMRHIQTLLELVSKRYPDLFEIENKKIEDFHFLRKTKP